MRRSFIAALCFAVTTCMLSASNEYFIDYNSVYHVYEERSADGRGTNFFVAFRAERFRTSSFPLKIDDRYYPLLFNAKTVPAGVKELSSVTFRLGVNAEKLKDAPFTAGFAYYPFRDAGMMLMIHAADCTVRTMRAGVWSETNIAFEKPLLRYNDIAMTFGENPSMTVNGTSYAVALPFKTAFKECAVSFFLDSRYLVFDSVALGGGAWRFTDGFDRPETSIKHYRELNAASVRNNAKDNDNPMSPE